MRTSRILFTCVGSRVRLTPLLTLAGAARDRGHRVAIASGPAVIEVARRSGHVGFEAGQDRLRTTNTNTTPYTSTSGLEMSARAGDLELIMARWLPDLVVHEFTELAAPLVATALGVPHVDVGVGPMPSPEQLATIVAATRRHWHARRLDPDPLGGLFRYLYLDPCPPALQMAARGSPYIMQAFRATATPTDSARVAPAADVRIVNGAFEDILSGLATARPVLIVPSDEDQRWNARAVESAGAGAIVEPGSSRAQIREVAERVLADPSFARRARVVAGEIDALPTAHSAIEAFDRLL